MDERKSRWETREQLGGDATLNLETTWLDLRANWEVELTGHGHSSDLEK